MLIKYNTHEKVIILDIPITSSFNATSVYVYIVVVLTLKSCKILNAFKEMGFETTWGITAGCDMFTIHTSSVMDCLITHTNTY